MAHTCLSQVKCHLIFYLGTWTLEELSEVLKVPVASLRRKMTFWLQQGVLREDPQGTFMVIEEEQKDQAEKVVLIDSDEEGDSAMASQADQKEEELQVRKVWELCLEGVLEGKASHVVLSFNKRKRRKKQT